MIVSIQRFCRDSILYGNIYGRQFQIFWFILSFAGVVHMAIERNVLIQSPSTRAMVNHDISNRVASERIVTMPYLCFAAAETHMAYHYIMRIYPKRLSGNTYPVTRSCLSCNSDIWSPDDNGRFQFNNTWNIEDNDTCSTCLTSLTERTGTTVIQISHGNHLTATTAETVHTSSFSTGESRNSCLRQIVWTGSPRNIRTTFSRFFLYNRQCFCPGFVRAATFFTHHFLVGLLRFLSQLGILGHCHWSNKSSHTQS